MATVANGAVRLSKFLSADD